MKLMIDFKLSAGKDLCDMERSIVSKATCAIMCGLGLLLLAGCGPSSDRQALEGTVTFDAAPLADGSIMLRPLPGTRMPPALDIFPLEWLYEPLVPPGPYAELYIDGKLVEGADVSIEDGTPFGWGDVMGKALGVEIKRTRVPVAVLLKNHGATLPEGAWNPEEGANGVMRAEKKP